jgi:hypothetical protein
MTVLALVLTSGAAAAFYIALRKAQAERDELAIQIRMIVYCGLHKPLV